MKGFASIASLLCVAFMSVSAAPEGAVLELIKQGRKAYASRDWDEAIQFFSAAIVRDKEQDEAYVRRALTYVPKREPDTALAAINQALQIAPDEPNYLVIRSQVTP